MSTLDAVWESLTVPAASCGASWCCGQPWLGAGSRHQEDGKCGMQGWLLPSMMDYLKRSTSDSTDKHFSGVLCVSECFGLYDFNYYLTLFVLRGRKRPPLSWVSS